MVGRLGAAAWLLHFHCALEMSLRTERELIAALPGDFTCTLTEVNRLNFQLCSVLTASHTELYSNSIAAAETLKLHSRRRASLIELQRVMNLGLTSGYNFIPASTMVVVQCGNRTQW